MEFNMITAMRYEILSQNEILDTQTNLIWQNEIVKNLSLTYDQALEYAKYISNETGLTWRVPMIEELVSLIDRSQHFPASSFPNMLSNWFWSSTLYVGDVNHAWYVNFYDGTTSNQTRLTDYYTVRLVRDKAA
jgi:hypothetical protein